MADINLLPGDISKNSSVKRIIRFLKTANLVGTFLLIIFFVVGAGVLIIYAINARGVETNIGKLKQEMNTLSETEQQYTLVKNRIAGIKEISTKNNAVSNFSNFTAFYGDSSSYGDLSTINLSSSQVEISSDISNPANLKTYFEKVMSSGYSKIVMQSLKYLPGKGYQAGFQFFK